MKNTEKIITIHDYNGTGKEIKIKNFENVAAITCVVLTGDEVLQIAYKNGLVEIYDSSEERCSDFFDGVARIPLSRIDEFSKMGSYEMLDVFAKQII